MGGRVSVGWMRALTRPSWAEAAIATERLELSPLRVADADELVEVLGDPALHEFIGGRPDTLAELRRRYAAMVAGPGRPGELWRNWVVRRRADAAAVGTVQATLTRHGEGWRAEVAWVVGVGWQGRGYAVEAARALVGWPPATRSTGSGSGATAAGRRWLRAGG